MMTRAERYKIRYQMYRDMGYSPTEARKLRTRSLDVNNIKIDKNGKVIKANNYKKALYQKQTEMYSQKIRNAENKSIYSNWGLFTQDNRYKDDTMRIVQSIKKREKINSKQAFYFLYFMQSNGLTYKQTREQLMSNKEFEMYAKKWISRRSINIFS